MEILKLSASGGELTVAALPLAGHTGRLLQSLCFTSMSFLLLHIIYQITVNSLLAGSSIASDFNCEYTAAFIVKALKVARFIGYVEIKAHFSVYQLFFSSKGWGRCTDIVSVSFSIKNAGPVPNLLIPATKMKEYPLFLCHMSL